MKIKWDMYPPTQEGGKLNQCYFEVKFDFADKKAELEGMPLVNGFFGFEDTLGTIEDNVCEYAKNRLNKKEWAYVVHTSNAINVDMLREVLTERGFKENKSFKVLPMRKVGICKISPKVSMEDIIEDVKNIVEETYCRTLKFKAEQLDAAALKMNQLAYEGLQYLEVEDIHSHEDYPDLDR